MDNHAPSMLKSTMIGGAVFGAIGAIPVIGMLMNCLCCSLVTGGGFFAAFLYSRECERGGSAFGPAAGAGVGLVAALFYTLSTTTLTLLAAEIRDLVFGEVDPREELEEALGQLADAGVDTEVAEQVAEVMLNMSPAFMAFLAMCFWLVIGAVFSTAGGLIGGTVFKVEPPAPSAPGTPSMSQPPTTPQAPPPQQHDDGAPPS